MAFTESSIGPRVRAQAGRGGLHLPSLIIALLGAGLTLALTVNLWLAHRGVYMGSHLYDLYFSALTHGRFDLPLRELRLEGHYQADGTGYLYHGLGPLITRLPFAPFVDFPTTWITPLSIWFWSMLGNICCHRAFTIALSAAPIEREKTRGAMRTLIALVVWMSGPAWILTSNGALYSEPIGMAYATGSAFILVLARCAFARADMAPALVPLSLLAGFTLHARPHLAVGYYAGVCVIAAFVVWRGTPRAWLRAGLAMAVLGLFGGLLLLSNELRFHDPEVMHGSFGKSGVEYGWIYLGVERPDSARAKGFSRYGQFNAQRILPGAALYALIPPSIGGLKQVRDGMEADFHAWNPATSFVRIENPEIGIVFVWPIMTILMILGLAQRALWRMPQAAGMLAVSIGSLLLLSYGTITWRYHVDLWPLLMLPALFGVAPMVRYLDRQAGRRFVLAVVWLLAAFALGASMSLLGADGHRKHFFQAKGLWTREFCMKVLAGKGLTEARRRALCAVSYERGMEADAVPAGTWP